MAVVEVKNLSFTYSKKTPYQTHALTDVSFSIEEGEFFFFFGAIRFCYRTILTYFLHSSGSSSASMETLTMKFT